MFSLFSASHSKAKTIGFSLVELVVSIAIIVLVLSIVITQQNGFNRSVLLRSQAYEIALTIRETQLSAVSAINAMSGGAEDFRSVIGVHFDTTANFNQRYTVFLDEGSGFYESGLGDIQMGVSGILDPRFEIGDIRLNGASVASGQVSITFVRPNFDARFKTSALGALETSGVVEIDVVPTNGIGVGCPDDVRTIEITATGQVAVLKCP